MNSLPRRLLAEFSGTFMLLAAVVGSGLMIDDLLVSDPGVALFAHGAAVAAVLGAAIMTFGTVSGAHFNPAVSLSLTLRGDLAPPELLPYVVTQLLGGLGGTICANLLFRHPAMEISDTARSGGHVLASEFFATTVLVIIVIAVVRGGPDSSIAPIPLWVGGAVFSTSSMCFANPAVTVGRIVTASYTGIRWLDAAQFLLVQGLAALAGTALAAYIFADRPSRLRRPRGRRRLSGSMRPSSTLPHPQPTKPDTPTNAAGGYDPMVD